MQQIGPYLIERELGRGGMGAVYAVRHPEDPRPLALKLIMGVAEEEQLQRFGREAEVMARVQHPNVVRVHQLGRCSLGPYLVTERVEGEDLEDRLKRGGALDPEEAAGIVASLANALSALHAAGVVHRDLKPANVILRPDGTPVLLDFGVARDEQAESLTQTGQVLGTPAYMSPEQAAGERTRMGKHTDIYGLGAVLLALISGRPPFSGGPSEIVRKVLMKEPRWPSLDNPRVPHGLEAVCRKAMAKEPHQRYKDAGAFEADLRRFLAGEGTSASGELSAARPRGRRAGAIAGGLLLLVSAGGGVAWWSLAGPDATTGPEGPRGPSDAELAAELERLRALPLEDSGLGRRLRELEALRPDHAGLSDLAEARRGFFALKSAPSARRLSTARAWLGRWSTRPEAGRVREVFVREVLAGEPARELEFQAHGMHTFRATLLDEGQLAASFAQPNRKRANCLSLWELASSTQRAVSPTHRRDLEAGLLLGDSLLLAGEGQHLHRLAPDGSCEETALPSSAHGDVMAFAVSRERGLIALGYRGGRVQLARWPSLEPVERPLASAPHKRARGLAFLGGGRWLLCAGGRANRSGALLIRWDLEQGTVDTQELPDAPTFLRAAPDGLHADESSTKLNELRLYDGTAPQLRLVRRFLGEGARVHPSLQGVGATEAQPAHDGTPRDARFSRDGALLISVSGDRERRIAEMRLWRVADGRELSRRRVEGTSYQSLDLSPAGTFLLSAGQRYAGNSRAGFLELWQIDVTTAQAPGSGDVRESELATLEATGLRDPAFATRLAELSRRAPQEPRLRELAAAREGLLTLEALPPAQQLPAAEAWLRRWPRRPEAAAVRALFLRASLAGEPELRVPVEFHHTLNVRARFVERGRSLLTYSARRSEAPPGTSTLALWSLPGFQLREPRFSEVKRSIFSSFSLKEQVYLVGSGGLLHVLDPQRPRYTGRTLTGLGDAGVIASAVSEERGLLALGLEDGRVCLFRWPGLEPAELELPRIHQSRVNGLAFAGKGRYLISVGGNSPGLSDTRSIADPRLVRWDLETGTHRTRPLRGRAEFAATAADDRHVVCGVFHVHQVLFFDAFSEELEPVDSLRGEGALPHEAIRGLVGEDFASAHQGQPRAGVFSPDGTRLYTAAADRTVNSNELRVWDVASRSELAAIREVGERCTLSLDISPDGSRLLLCGEVRDGDYDSAFLEVWRVDVPRDSR